MTIQARSRARVFDPVAEGRFAKRDPFSHLPLTPVYALTGGLCQGPRQSHLNAFSLPSNQAGDSADESEELMSSGDEAPQEKTMTGGKHVGAVHSALWSVDPTLGSISPEEDAPNGEEAELVGTNPTDYPEFPLQTHARPNSVIYNSSISGAYDGIKCKTSQLFEVVSDSGFSSSESSHNHASSKRKYLLESTREAVLLRISG
ncbi:hypothetical protein F5050DRAFT_1811167 [Lentinula boryana]|uniref:Uncharacterized protein n=1 Tax=Lentinula boryana TaxID=40481 RepID=A0ABQ8Q2T4_9AGAR|nr:hypothetical protein F5050DRAFT_1811167 [Lentinula boryana]